jgi:hypothetical protein
MARPQNSGLLSVCLIIADDSTTEAVAIVPARALGGRPVTQVLEQLAASRGLPQVLRPPSEAHSRAWRPLITGRAVYVSGVWSADFVFDRTAEGRVLE